MVQYVLKQKSNSDVGNDKGKVSSETEFHVSECRYLLTIQYFLQY